MLQSTTISLVLGSLESSLGMFTGHLFMIQFTTDEENPLLVMLCTYLGPGQMTLWPDWDCSGEGSSHHNHRSRLPRYPAQAANNK